MELRQVTGLPSASIETCAPPSVTSRHIRHLARIDDDFGAAFPRQLEFLGDEDAHG